MAEMDKSKVNLKEFIDNLNIFVNKDVEIVFSINVQDNKDLLKSFCQYNINSMYKKAWGIILEQVPTEFLEDEVLKFLIDNSIQLIELAHKNLTNEWLMRIYNMDNMCKEALITVALRLLDCEENEIFYTFIKKYDDMYLFEYILKHIIYLDIFYCNRKDKYLFLLQELHNKFNEQSVIIPLVKKVEQYLYLIDCKDEKVLSSAIESDDYWQLLALSKNTNCSTVIIEKLINVKNVKYAKLICKNAKELRYGAVCNL